MPPVDPQSSEEACHAVVLSDASSRECSTSLAESISPRSARLNCKKAWFHMLALNVPFWLWPPAPSRDCDVINVSLDCAIDGMPMAVAVHRMSSAFVLFPDLLFLLFMSSDYVYLKFLLRVFCFPWSRCFTIVGL